MIASVRAFISGAASTSLRRTSGPKINYFFNVEIIFGADGGAAGCTSGERSLRLFHFSRPVARSGTWVRTDSPTLSAFARHPRRRPMWVLPSIRSRPTREYFRCQFLFVTVTGGLGAKRLSVIAITAPTSRIGHNTRMALRGAIQARGKP